MAGQDIEKARRPTTLDVDKTLKIVTAALLAFHLPSIHLLTLEFKTSYHVINIYCVMEPDIFIAVFSENSKLFAVSTLFHTVRFHELFEENVCIF